MEPEKVFLRFWVMKGSRHTQHIVFHVAPYGASWQLTRNDRLVCFFSTQSEAVHAAGRFVKANEAAGFASEIRMRRHSSYLSMSTELSGNSRIT